jgi:hypothetical protein
MNLEDIKSFCKLGLTMVPGIKTLKIVDAREMSALGDINPGATIYNIEFRRHTGSFSHDHKKSAAGDYYTNTARVYVPRYRFMTENMVTELMDRKVIVFGVDKNGEEFSIYFAEFRSQFTTDDKPSGSNGYTWTFTADDRRRRFYPILDTIELTGNEDVVGPPDVGDPEPNEPGPSGEENCCVTILTTAVPEVPPPSGNILNRNKFVKTVDGRTFFIDKNGLSIELGAGSSQYELIEGDGSSVYETSFDFADFDDKNYILSRNGVILQHASPLTEINQYSVGGSSISLPIPLEISEIIQIWKI